MADRPPVSGEPPEWQKRNVQEFLEQQSRRVSGEPSTEWWMEYPRSWNDLCCSGNIDDAHRHGIAIGTRDTLEARATPPSLDDDNPVLRLLEVVMSLRRMVKDGHPDDRSWFRIMSENLSSVMDLTDMALMDGNEAVVALLTSKEEQP